MDFKTIDIGTQPSRELLELAESIRRLAAKMVRIDSGEEELRAARTKIDAMAEQFEVIARKGNDPRILASIEPGESDMRPYYPASAATWHCNPIFPPLEVEVDGNLVRGSLNLGLEYEGPPGCIHGGVVSLIFDQLLGHANGANGTYGMTVELKVSYHRPTPLGTDLEFEAQVKNVDGRKITTEGVIMQAGERTASAVGLFVNPVFETSPMLSHLGDEQVVRIREHHRTEGSDEGED